MFQEDTFCSFPAKVHSLNNYEEVLTKPKLKDTLQYNQSVQKCEGNERQRLRNSSRL